MNAIMLYHIWNRIVVELDDGTAQVQYELDHTVTSLEEAQAITQSSNGDLVYTWSTAWYGEQG